MPPRQGTPQPPQDAKPVGRKTVAGSSPSSGNTFGRRKVHFGNAPISPTGSNSRFSWSTIRWAGPISWWENTRGPAISFSTAGEEVWAAICGDESDIGIDVAGSAEFPEGYPVHRVFHVQELHQALGLAGGDLAKAAALLWSVKEAVAKALGCAFHLVNPRDIHVDPSAAEEGGPAFSVRLTGNALECFPMANRPAHHGTFAAPGRDVAFHRRIELAGASSRRAELL